MDTKILTISELIVALKGHLETLGYSKTTIDNFNVNWKHFKAYAMENNVENFATDFGIKFLLEKYQIQPDAKCLERKKILVRRAIELLDFFQSNGRIYKHRPRRLMVWQHPYNEVCERFMISLAQKQLSERTQHIYQTILENFTAYLVGCHILTLDDLNAKIIDEYIFVTYRGYQKTCVYRYCTSMAIFLDYAYKNGYTCINTSSFVPRLRDYRYTNVPSIYTEEEINRILAAVDRANAVGKRDYAILLLAIQYGMRVGDIKSLKLGNLDFELKMIQYIQNKTGSEISFDMLPNVGWALIDYIKNARPKTNSENIFIRMIAPYDGFSDTCSLTHIINKYLSRAGILRTKDRHFGMHTFRHSLASRMLEQGNPLHIISKTLGHAELASTTTYTKINITALSLCALEVPNAAL